MRTRTRGWHWWDLAVALGTIAIALALLLRRASGG
jgi:hypothetical protein